MTEHAVVIAGGGPTGLMLAGELALAGVDVAIVERRPSQGESMRAHTWCSAPPRFRTVPSRRIHLLPVEAWDNESFQPRESDVRKFFITLLVPAMVLGSLLAPAQAKTAKKKPPVTFEASGSIALANPTDLMDVGITRAEFESGCSVPAATQGVDGYVIELPPKVTAVASRVFATGTSTSGVGLLDMFFFDESCTERGRILGSDDFDPIMAAGTKFVLVTNWLGDPTDFTFSATEVR